MKDKLEAKTENKETPNIYSKCCNAGWTTSTTDEGIILRCDKCGKPSSPGGSKSFL